MKKVILCAIVCAMTLTGCLQGEKKQAAPMPEVCNPIPLKLGDPFLLHAADGRYYMYGTSLGTASRPSCLTTW